MIGARGMRSCTRALRATGHDAKLARCLQFIHFCCEPPADSQKLNKKLALGLFFFRYVDLTPYTKSQAGWVRFLEPLVDIAVK